MLCSDLLKYNSDLYSDIFTVKLSKYNFHCSQTTFDRQSKFVSFMKGFFFQCKIKKYFIWCSLSEIYFDLTQKQTNIHYLQQVFIDDKLTSNIPAIKAFNSAGRSQSSLNNKSFKLRNCRSQSSVIIICDVGFIVG